MTFVGKILVIVIMVFALFFLALSTVVFTTEMNWSDHVKKLNADITTLKGEKARLEGEVGTQKTLVSQAKDEMDKASKAYESQLKTLREDNNRRQEEITKQRTNVETALQQVDAAQKEASARIEEAGVLKKNLATVQQQRDEFKLQKTDLDQQILQLKRELEVAQSNNKNLRDRVAVYSGFLQKIGQPTDVKVLQAQGGAAPPELPVEGEVARVSPDNRRVQLTVDSNDGLVVGNVLDLFSTTPTAEYLGKVEIISVDVNQSVGRVAGGKTVHGKKIKEGDHVTSQIKRRG